MADAGTTPQLLGFGLANYRSFGPEGFLLTKPRKVNILVGKNNSGKSNVLRAIHAFRELHQPNFGRKLFASVDKHRRGDTPVDAVVVLPLEPLIPAQHKGSQTVSDIFKSAGTKVTVRWDTSSGELVSAPELEGITLGHLRWLMNQLAKVDLENPSGKRELFMAQLGKHLIQQAVAGLQAAFQNLLVIPVFREIEEGGEAKAGASSVEFNGHNIIRALRGMQVPHLEEEAKRGVFDKIQQFTRELVGVPELELQVPQEDRLYIKMNGLRLPLENYGTGIHHLVILCSALAMHSGRVVTIEEPEIHLHPDLQRKFLRFIAEQTANTYYITTHSNVFLDARSDVNVYHVRFDGQRSEFVHAETTARSREVLTDMGYKASDLLQSNCVIWVEGPSDRVYLNQWLALTAPDLVEGIHYSIAFYGGSVLPHFTASADPVDDLVDVLRINRHAVFVMDRDGDSETAQLGAGKSRIQRALGEDACWVTKGREIENYIPLGLIQRVLREKYPAVERVEFGLNDSIDDVLTRMEGGPAKYDKVASARRFAAAMTTDDLDVLDLRTRLDVVERLIRQWNHETAPASAALR